MNAATKTTSRRTARKTTEVPIAPAGATGAPDNGRHDVSFQFTKRDFIAALEDAWVTRKESFHMEIAVGLALFAARGRADKPQKKELRELFASAGYACGSITGEDYKTVQRRIGVVADLFNFIGGVETIRDKVGDAKDRKKYLAALTDYLDNELKVYSINGILEYVKKPVVYAKKEQTGQVPAPHGAGTPGSTPQGVQQPPAPPAEAPKAPEGKKADEQPKEPEKAPEGQQEPSEEDKAVMAAVGKTVDAQRQEQAKEEAEPARVMYGRRAIDGLPSNRILRAGPLVLHIPMETTFEHATQLAMDLLTFANNELKGKVPANTKH